MKDVGVTETGDQFKLSEQIQENAPIDLADYWFTKPIETRVAKHHILTMDAIQRCIEAPYGRLMIFEPPGSAKSTYASVVAPTWAMGKYPGLQVLETSYASRPIERHSKRGRQIVSSYEYEAIFGAYLAQGSRAADQWELSNGSHLYAAGLMGAITSTRCGLGIIDDPVAGRAEARSETVRKSTLEAYQDDFLTRLTPEASVILIQTRWDEEDLAGSILPEDWAGENGLIKCRDGQTWEVLCLPAQCESANDPLGREIGEYLWPEWFQQRHWDIFKANTRTWEALYQQRPRKPEGSFFTQASLLVEGAPVEPIRRCDTVFATMDTAIKTGKSNDGVGVIFWSLSNIFSPPLTLLDWDLKQIEGATLEVWLPTIFQRLEIFARELEARLGSAGVWIEDKTSGSVLLQQAQKPLFVENRWESRAIDSKLTSLGKSERAINCSGYVQAGLVKLSKTAYDRVCVYHGSSRNHLLSQILSFDPGIKDMGEDDLLDCFSYGIAIGVGNRKGY